ncbi:MAG: protein kinase [Planctomycetes bacterium]|nr:protein kinase [Planctomycetota bacterium]
MATTSGSLPLDNARLGQIAITSGCITASQLSEALAEIESAAQRGEHLNLGQILTRHGWVTTSQLSDLLQQHAERPLPTDRYEIMQELGRGGMAVVYRARDKRLGREVALKVLRQEFNDSQAAMARMMREARAIAALNHPNVVRLHDVSDDPQSPYLVMEYVRGNTLDVEMRNASWPLRERVRVVEQIARGVHAAHQQNIVHRDLKPGNIMIEESGRVVVMDFGLAHLNTGDSRLTRTGTVIGTPQYMAPEQVQGRPDAINARTDVYAIGVVLYEAIAGSPLFRGTVAEIYHKILTQEATSPRRLNPRVSLDLETICLRAIAKEQRDRYGSAEALAEDLARYLAGEAIAARPFGLWTRVGRRVARRKAATAATTAVIVLASGSAGLWIALRETQQIQTAAQRDLIAQMHDTYKVCSEPALVRRRAGITDRKYLVRFEQNCRKVIAEMPHLAEPHYLWGCILRTHLEFDAALQQQELALQKEPDYAPALAERALLLLRLYRTHLQAGRRAWIRAQAERSALLESSPMILPHDEAKKEKITADLRTLDSLFARALREYLESRPREARRLLEQAIRETPYLEEAYAWLAQLAIEEQSFDEALQSLSSGLERDQGYTPFWEDRAHLRAEQGLRDLAAGRDPSGSFRQAVADYQEAIRRSPSPGDSLGCRGTAHLDWAEWPLRRGEDPSELLAKAVEDFDQAVPIAATADLLVGRGLARTRWGQWKATCGEPADDLYQMALKDVDTAVQMSSDHADAWRARAQVHASCALVRQDRDEDPTPLYQTALEDIDHAVRLDVSLPGSWAVRGEIRAHWAAYQLARDEDPDDLLQQALADYDRAIELDRQRDVYWRGRGRARALRVEHARKNAGQAVTLFEEAEGDFERAIAINPAHPDTYLQRGACRRVMGRWSGALTDFQEAARRCPRLEPRLRRDIEELRRRVGESY